MTEGKEIENQGMKGSLLRRVGQEKPSVKGKETDVFGGRRVIIILFLLTVGLSLVFWFWANLSIWLQGMFGPSTWTFSR